MQIEKDGVHVLFACKCMTHDESNTRFWYHREYEPVNYTNLEEKLQQHTLHCPYEETSDEIKAWTKIMQTM